MWQIYVICKLLKVTYKTPFFEKKIYQENNIHAKQA